MLGQGAIEVKLITGLIVGRAVLGVEVKPGECRQLEAILAAEVAGRGGRLEGPVVITDVGERAFGEVACGRVNPERPLPLQVTFVPTEHQRQKLNVSKAVVRTLTTKSGTPSFATKDHVRLYVHPDIRDCQPAPYCPPN